ncbi:universal stress protein [Wenyingzhuangia sp. 2_MG-2023]|uniref:universal stress protein n=1 Tax=Wenyingzhuangia sp. 2_MG-2023 TaxID=3062639 RepID=UPI0026E273F8|nr:universal stress protein [Wenyingzhuangia sp. 2_MG-2023]MDO6737411.1 universal stress protein [Wenyingzhuangia sp. 2_MG-2023]
MKNIIIPVDFSKYSEYAVKAAAMLAKKHSGNLTLVHMLEMPTGYSDNGGDHNKAMVFMLKFAEKKFETFVDKDYLEDLEVNIIIKHYALFPEIGTLAEEQNADLIVMGSHGVSNHNDYFLGSNTEKVVKTSKIPVLVIKEELHDIEFTNSVYVSDFKLESIEAYLKAQAFFNMIDVKPTLLFVNKSDGGFVSSREMESRFEDFLMEAHGNLDNLEYFENYDDYTVLEGVNYFVEKNDISLVSIATHGKSSLSKFFNHSISLDIANHLKKPVLTLLI